MKQNLWHDFSPGPDAPDLIYVVVEVPKASRNKFEYSKEAGTIALDRVLYSPLHYPGDYGFIPRTYFEDGDPTDVLVMTNQPTFPGCIIKARPIGMFKMIDNGELDYKILAVPADDPSFDEYWDVSNIPQHFPKEVGHFFMVYKELQGATVTNEGWAGVREAKAQIRRSMERYSNEFPIHTSERQRVSSGTKWERAYGYSRAVRVENMVYVAGTTAGEAGEDARSQTQGIFEKIKAALTEAGAKMEDVVRSRMYVVHKEDMLTVAEVHGEYFEEIRPVSTLVQVAGLIEPHLRVEIEVEAIIQDDF